MNLVGWVLHVLVSDLQLDFKFKQILATTYQTSATEDAGQACVCACVHECVHVSVERMC